MKCAGLWQNGARCLDQSRTCGPLLHTPEDVLLPMVFIKQVINGLCVCGPVPSVFTGPAQAEVYVCSSYTEGEKLINFCILKILIEAQRGNHDMKTVRAQAV